MGKDKDKQVDALAGVPTDDDAGKFLSCFRSGMELVPGCDQVDPRGVKWDDGHIHGQCDHRDQLGSTATSRRREKGGLVQWLLLRMAVRYCRIRRNVLFALSQPLCGCRPRNIRLLPHKSSPEPSFRVYMPIPRIHYSTSGHSQVIGVPPIPIF